MTNMMAAASAGGNQMSDSTAAVPRPSSAMSSVSIENIVNPLGKVTTIVRPPVGAGCGSGGGGGGSSDAMTDSFQSSDIYFPDQYIHENCDEALFRPVVTIVEMPKGTDDAAAAAAEHVMPPKAPAHMSTNLIVPVIVPVATPKVMPPPVVEKVEEKLVEKAPEQVKEDPMQQEDVEEVVEVVVMKPKKQQQQQKNTNKKNKEKTPPPVVMTKKEPEIVMPTPLPMTETSNTAKPSANIATATKSNGSKGRKSSGQEPKAGKIRKSEKNAEIIMNVEEEVKEEVDEIPPPPPKQPQEVVVEPPTKEDSKAMVDFDQLPEVAVVAPLAAVVASLPSSQEMEVIQDSLMRETIVQAVTVNSSGSGGGGGKKKKNRQKTPPKVEEFEAPSQPSCGEEKPMVVDISETKYDLTECITAGGDQGSGVDEAEFETMYADPLVPLEPFDASLTFEAVECPNEGEIIPPAENVDESLMTFESPVLEEDEEGSKALKGVEEDEVEILVDPQMEKLQKVFTNRNLVFAMCGSWREGGSSNEEAAVEEEESVNISSAPGWQLEIHEDYMDMDSGEKKLMLESMTAMDANKLSPVAALTASTGSSEEEVSSSSTNSSSSSNEGGKTGTATTTTATEEDDEEAEVEAEEELRKRIAQLVGDDDEELQPLITGKETREPFGAKKGDGEVEEDVEGGQSQSPAKAAAAAASKESTPTPGGGGGGGGKGGQSSKKKSRKKKR